MLGVAENHVTGDADREPATRVGSAEEIAVWRERAGRALSPPLGLDGGARVGELGEQRLDLPVARVPGREHFRGGVEVLVAEGDDLHRPLHSQRCRRRR